MSINEKFTSIRKGLLEFLVLKIVGGAMVYVALDSVTHRDCSIAANAVTVFDKVPPGAGLGDNTTCAGTDACREYDERVSF